MATWIPTEPSQGGLQPIATTDTVRNHPLGFRCKGKDISLTTPLSGEFIYLQGVASTAVGSWVNFYEDDGTTILSDTDSSAADKIGPVAVAMSANVASQYGWYQICGKASALALASFADNGDVYLTSTGGSVDDAVVDGYLVHKAKGASTIVGAGLADFELQYPYTDGITTND